MTAKRFLGTLSLLVLTGCPYTEGCEGQDSAAKSDTLANAPLDAGAGGDTDNKGNDKADNTPSVPLGPTKPNCEDLKAQCAGESCCAAANVPGGSFNRLNDA